MYIKTRKAFRAFFIVAVIILIISFCLWVIFPIIFPIFVKQNLVISVGDGGYPSQTAYFWSKPPSDTIMYFYYFNITNPEEVIYEGEKPVLLEVGPFAVRETEEKRGIQFQKNGEEVYYENYKRFQFVPEYSCEKCAEDALLTLPNSPALGAISGMIDPQFDCDDVCKLIIDIGLLLLGEYPFRTVKFIEVTYTGYEDPFLRFAHSELFTALGDIFNNGSSIVPIKIPAMKKMAFFYGYNNTNDENYVIKTGKNNIEDLGRIVKWANSNILPNSWWSTVDSRGINGSDSGSFNKPYLDKDSVIPFFQSYMCRSFYATYVNESEVQGIPCYTYEVPAEAYDTTLDQNSGFRYRNFEKVNYFKDWDPCPNKTTSTPKDCSESEFIDCSKKENFCHDCCDGNYVDGTYLLPPGLFPLSCYPGRNNSPPFTVFYSAPHYYFAPDITLNTIRGLSPANENHKPFSFDREPQSGMLTRMKYRLMASMPVFRNEKATISMHLPDVIIPVFWIDTQTQLQNFMYHTIYNSFVAIPKIINIFKFVSLAISCLCFVISFFCRFTFASRSAQPLQKRSVDKEATKKEDTIIAVENHLPKTQN